jgi:Tol biopolymer transport system component
MSGVSDRWGWLPPDIGDADPSPDGRYFVHNSNWDVDLYRSDVDGSNRTDLTATIGGTNCEGRWSPDGSQIVFMHSSVVGSSDPSAPRPCDGPFEVWAVSADGAVLQQLVGPDQGGAVSPSFSPDGYCISYTGVQGVTLINTDGTDRRVISIGSHPAWSRDGSALAVENSVPDTVGGVSGVWRQIVTIDPLGNNPRVVYQHFVAGNLPEFMSYWVGPAYPTWSPRGDRIVFAGMDILGNEGDNLYLPWPWSGGELPCDVWRCGGRQLELYLVNSDGQSPPIRLTNDDASERAGRWNGPNTAPDHPAVTVDNTTVAFSSVAGSGLTTVIRDNEPPALPSGFEFCGDYYNISTTAPHSGLITVTMTYEDSEVPGGLANERALRLLHYEDGDWVDITTSLDTVNNIITGECTGLSPFGLTVPTVKPNWQPPLKNGTSVSSPTGPYKRGSTIPVKFSLLDGSGQPIPDAQAHAMVAQLDVCYEKPSVGGTAIDPGDYPPDAGDVFRYDAGAHQFIFNLSTKNPAWLANYTYGLDLMINGIKAGDVFFSLK